MPRHYKLRLRDGTILAVDQEGLRTWKLDDKAMVQPAGTHAWRPLREVLAQLESIPTTATPPVVPPEPPAPSLESLVEMAPPVQVPAPAAPPDLGDTLRHIANASYDESRPLERPTPVADLPVIPFKPLDEDALDELELVEEGVDGQAGPAGSKLEPVGGRRVAETAEVLLGVVASSAERLGKLARSKRVEWSASGTYDRLRALAKMRPRGRRAALATGIAAGLVVAAATSPTWVPLLARLTQARNPRDDRPAVASLPAPPVEPREPELPPEVRLAVEKLPHLTPATIQLVMSRSQFGAADPPEIFRQAQATASRGLSALTKEEAHELGTLRGAILAALRPRERQRVRAYDRLRAGRQLLLAEDARVLGLFARGVRTLPPGSRERLQELFGKAIAAALASDTRPAETDPSFTPR